MLYLLLSVNTVKHSPHLNFKISLCRKFAAFSFGASDIIKIRPTYIISRILHIMMEELIFYADKIMVMCCSKNLHVYNCAIFPKLRQFDAREIYTY